MEQLEGILVKAEADKDADLQELIQYEFRFHHVVYTATRNQKLEELLLEFQAISSRLWHNLFFTKEHLQRMFDDQRTVLSALRARDGKRCGELLVKHTQAYFGRINGLKRS